MQRENLVGNRYGKLVVEEMLFHSHKTANNPKGKTYCLCRCDCGNSTITQAWALKSGSKQSCGCDSPERRSMAFRKKLEGQRFNRLMVIETLFGSKVRCKCDCGNEVIVSTTDVISGHTKSCGCLQKERASVSATKDFSGYVSDCGVKLLRQSHRNKVGQWMWECECGLCGKHFAALPAKIQNGHITSCGCRRQSSREQYIEGILKRENVDFRKQYTIPGCKDKQVLLFDFAIFSDGKLHDLIEYDGQQHFMAVNLFGGEDGLLHTQRRDMIKDDFCHKIGIALHRLPYTMSNADLEKSIMSIIYP